MLTTFSILLMQQRVPLRWYPPEYFKSNYYGFKGDVWAFGIVLWEMQTFGGLISHIITDMKCDLWYKMIKYTAKTKKDTTHPKRK